MKRIRLSRREFLQFGALASAGLALASCAQPTPVPTEPPAEQPTEAPAPEPTEPPAEEPTEAPAEAPAEAVSLYIIHNWGPDDAKGPALQSIFEDFMAANPGITIEGEVSTDIDIPTKVETAFLAGQEPDVVLQNWSPSSWKWIDDGVIVPVTDLAKDWGLYDAFVDSAITEFSRDGVLGSFPLEGFNWPIWYNMEILDAAGVTALPGSTNELVDAAEKIRTAGSQPFAIGGKDWPGMDWLMVSVGAWIDPATDNDTLKTGNLAGNPNIVAAFEEFVRLRDAGVFCDDAEGIDFAGQNAMFFNGEAAMLHGGSWSYAELPAEMEDKVQLGGCHYMEGAAYYTKPWWWTGFGGKGVHITRNGAAKMDAVEKFVKFFYQPDMIARFVEQAGMIPPLKEVPIDESKLSPLFVQSLEITPDLMAIWPPAPSLIPGEVYAGWYASGSLSFIPGTTAEEIIALLDNLYEQLE